MKEKNYKKQLIFISIISGTIIAILALVLFSLFNEVNNLRKLKHADELFIHAEFDSAMEVYQKVEPNYITDTLLTSRERLMHFKTTQHAAGFLNDSLRSQLLTKLQGCFLFAKQEKILDELNDTEILNGLLECYLQKSKKITDKAQAIEELENSGYLNFKNDRGVEIYYLGEMKDSTAHGEGIGLFNNQSYFRGQWQKNQRHGQGRFETRTGELYIGEYKNDRRNGKGTYWFRNGDYYTGEWKNSKRDGIGTVYSSKGDTIVHGYWENDRLNRSKTRKMLKD